MNGLNVTHYGVEDGLPQSQVRVIHQDAKGYLWVGTQGGLGRYNGREFSHFTSADGLAGNQIQALADDRDARLWVGTNLGLCVLSGRRFRCLATPDLDGRSIRALATHGDHLWVGTERAVLRLRMADGSVAAKWPLDAPVNVLLADAEGGVVAGTDAGLMLIEAGTGALHKAPLVDGNEPAVVSLWPEAGGIWIGTGAGLLFRDAEGRVRVWRGDTGVPEQTHISGIVPGPGGSLMVGSYRGLYRMHKNAPGRIQRVDASGREIVRTLFVDREGVIWVGHDNGMSKLAPTRFTGFDRERGLLADFVRTMGQDSRGRLWLGTRVGVQVVPLSDSGLALENGFTLNRAGVLPNDRIYAIEFMPSGGVLLATNGGVVLWREGQGLVRVFGTEEGLPSDRVRSLHRTSDGRIWVGTVSGVAVLDHGALDVDVPDELRDIYALNIRQDARGRVWFATRDHGLLRLDRDARVTRLFGGDFTRQTLWDLAPAGDGGMWVGSNGDGLFRIGPDGNVLRRMTRAHGLVNNFVWSVLVDTAGHVWAYTTRGLSRFDGDAVVNYDQRDGLLHLEGGATGALETRDGALWFASVGGIVRFDPDAADGNDPPPPVLIEGVTVDGAPVQPGQRLPHDHSEVTFEFVALTFQNENSTRYRYRIEGLNADWTELGGYRPITVARLGPGTYEFQVSGSNASGVWSRQPARFEFSVAAPLWMQFWFIALCAFGLVALVVSAWRLRVYGLRKRATELQQLVGERTRELEQANSRLRRHATTDPLTGLKNRRFLMDQVGHDVARSLRRYRENPSPEDAAIGFLLIDLDGFKGINDSHGHRAGDAVLQQVARALLDVARQSDYVVRWGGDEFLVVARDLDAEAGSDLAQRIVETLGNHSFGLGEHGRSLECRCSVGLCVFPFTRDEPEAVGWEQVVEMADAAAYLAKRDGGDRWVEILAASEVKAEDKADYLRAIRADAEDIEAKGRIRIRRGGSGE